MKALWNNRGEENFGAFDWTRPRRSALTLGSLLLVLLMAGCSVVEDLSVNPAPTALAAATSTTQASVTTSTEAMVAEATTTTAAPDTTLTTIAESATTTTVTEAPSTTATTQPPAPDTTVATIPATEDADNVIYEITDWSLGVSGWAAAGQWKTAGGMLVTDGSSDSFAVAPVDLTDYPDYAVEAEVQILDPEAETDVFLMARMINGLGYWAGFDGSATRMVIGYGEEDLGDANFTLDGDWHTYRLEVRGNTVKLFLEQAEVARAMDNRALEPGTVGIYCGSGQINVRSFRVTAL